MNTFLSVQNGHISGGTPAQQVLMRVLWGASYGFVPLKFRGFWRLTRLVQRVTGVSERQWLELPNGLRVSVDMADPYWNRLISPHFSYEPELHALLAKLQDVPFAFIDCGANMGYWSCTLASGMYGAHKVFSIEPLSDNMALLKQHLAANGLDAHCYHNAVTEHSGKVVNLYKPGGHASVSLNDESGSDATAEQVTTMMLDDVLPDLPKECEHVFVKLDVEGHEVEALKGAHALLKKNPLIFYEDHGKDTDSIVSAYVLKELGYKVMYMSDDGALQAMQSLSDIQKLKTDTMKGYNFAAFAEGSVWEGCL